MKFEKAVVWWTILGVGLAGWAVVLWGLVRWIES